MRTRVARVALALLLAAVASVHISAQPQQFSALVVRVGVPFTVVANHSGDNVVGFRVRDNGATVASGLKDNVWTDGVVRIRLTSGLAIRGAHELRMVAYNDGGETASTSSVTVKVGR